MSGTGAPGSSSAKVAGIDPGGLLHCGRLRNAAARSSISSSASLHVPIVPASLVNAERRAASCFSCPRLPNRNAPQSVFGPDCGSEEQGSAAEDNGVAAEYRTSRDRPTARATVGREHDSLKTECRHRDQAPCYLGAVPTLHRFLAVRSNLDRTQSRSSC
jgi:hypothetical protein